MNEIRKQRIEELDYVKGLAIFLVIMGHATDNLATPLWRLVIYSFHMPLFFMVSGMVTKPADVMNRGTIGAFLIKNFKALLVPYIIFAAVYSWFSYQNFGIMLYGTFENLVTALDFMVEQMTATPLTDAQRNELSDLCKQVIEEPTKRGFRVKLII